MKAAFWLADSTLILNFQQSEGCCHLGKAQNQLSNQNAAAILVENSFDLFLWCIVMNRMLCNWFPHLKFYCLQLKMGFNYPLIEGNKTSNGEINYVTFYSLQYIKGIDQTNIAAEFWLVNYFSKMVMAFWLIENSIWQHHQPIKRLLSCWQSNWPIRWGLMFAIYCPNPLGTERSFLHYWCSEVKK